MERCLAQSGSLSLPHRPLAGLPGYRRASLDAGKPLLTFGLTLELCPCQPLPRLMSRLSSCPGLAALNRVERCLAEQSHAAQAPPRAPCLAERLGALTCPEWIDWLAPNEIGVPHRPHRKPPRMKRQMPDPPPAYASSPLTLAQTCSPTRSHVEPCEDRCERADGIALSLCCLDGYERRACGELESYPARIGIAQSSSGFIHGWAQRAIR